MNGAGNDLLRLKRLTDRYSRSKSLEPLCQRLSGWLHSPEGEELLQAVLEQSPHRSVQGQACFALALLLKEKSRFVRLTRENDSERLSEFFREETIKRWSTLDPVILSSRAEKLFALASKKYGDLSHPRGRFADVASAELFEMRSLAVGKVAPEIEGEDIDGVRFKLSEYRGKVVLLVFWGHWCGACRLMYKEERQLVERFSGQPFVILRVNSDPDKDKLRTTLQKENLEGRLWWDGGSSKGPISRRWNVLNWPTIYLLDQAGVIRFKRVGVVKMSKRVSALVDKAER